YVAFASGANNELSGVRTPTGLNVWMRARPIALDITPSLDFGTVDLGVQSAPQNAVVTNTSGVDINIGAVTPPTAPFSIIANGCGGTLAPGTSCAITIVFTPPAPGSASSSVSVSGDGLSVSASLVGSGRAPVVPTPGSLTMTPGSANYGTGPVGTAFPSKKFTVSNPGQTAVTLGGSGLSGTGADQFTITTNACAGSLAPGGSCVIEVVAALTRQGSSTATLGIVGTGGQSAQSTLRVKATVQLFTPILKMNPGVVSAGGITAALGSAFPPNIDVQLAFEGEAPFATVHTDAAGTFRFDYLVLRNGVRIGGLQVVAIDQPQFTGVRAPLLIDLATFRPSGFSSPAFTSGVRTLVSRGG
ncbi:MAG: choice-of-anchor D domain-containing protein, partial [Ilumatobacteraceae bacterium]